MIDCLRSPSRRTGVVALLAIASAVVLLGGCAVGPDFARPAAPQTTTYGALEVPASTASAPGAAGAAQRFVAADALPQAWWSLFRSAELDALVGRALERNPTLEAARDSLRAAEATRRAGQGELLAPQVTAGVGGSRGQASRAVAPGAKPRSVYQATLGVSYELDAFGGNRREIEALGAQVDFQRYEVEAARLTVIGNVVSAAIRQASLRDQLQATLDVLALEEKQVRIVEAQLAAGSVSMTSVLQQRTQAAQTRATLPALRKAIAQTGDELAVFVGDLPADAPRAPTSLESLRLPADLPLTLPSALVRQRPDIRASEALLHAASAEVGVATANLYPRIDLSASAGSQVLSAARLFGGGGLFSLAGNLAQPIFDGGALRAKKKGAEAAYDQAGAQYRAVVLGAFRDVTDTLAAIEYDADTLARTAEAEQLADRSLQLAARQHALGATSTLALLESQRAYRQARLGRVQAEAARFADTATLFEVLGGGWSNSADSVTSIDSTNLTTR